MRRKRSLKTKLNTKLITDVGLAGIGVRLLPMVISKFVPLDSPTIYTVAGAGGTYVVGSLLKKPDMANAGIGLGIVEIIAPMLEEMIGGFVGSGATPTANLPVSPVPPTKSLVTGAVDLAGYGRLNDYVSAPERSSYWDYRSAY